MLFPRPLFPFAAAAPPPAMAAVNPAFVSPHRVDALPLHPKLQARLAQMGVAYLTEIQALSFPHMMADADILHSACASVLFYGERWRCFGVGRRWRLFTRANEALNSALRSNL